MITSHATDLSTGRLILEGSALWPESVATLDIENVAAIWLTARDDLFQRRIYNASQFEGASAKEKLMIQKFLGRTLLYNKRMMAAINRIGLVSMEVEETLSQDELSEMCLELLMKRP